MKQKYASPLILGLVLLGGCSSTISESRNVQDNDNMNKIVQTTPTPSASPRPFSKDLSELRAKFNRDKGKVRLVTLLSPT
jgi:hypothetical protein